MPVCHAGQEKDLLPGIVIGHPDFAISQHNSTSCSTVLLPTKTTVICKKSSDPVLFALHRNISE
jgi:hypothetical protein